MRSSKRKTKKAKSSTARRRAEQHESSMGFTTLSIPEGVSLFKPDKAGTYILDILPFTAKEGNPYCDEGEEHFERTFHVHRSVGPQENSYVCPAKTYGERCPICEYRAKEMKKAKPDEDLVKELAPKERQLFNVIDHGDLDKGVQLWEVSYHNFGKLLDSRIKNSDEDEGWDQFYFTGDEGKTLRVTLDTDSFGGNKFLKATAIDFKDRKKDVSEEYVENAVCLDDVPKKIDFDELQKIFLQVDEEEEEETKGKGKSTAKKKPVKAEEEDDEEEEDLEYEEEEDDEEEEDLEYEEEEEIEYEDDEDSEEEEEEDLDEEEDDEEEDLDEEEDDEEEWIDDEEYEEEEEEEPTPRKTAKKAATKKAPVKKATPKKAVKKAPAKKAAKKSSRK